MFCKAEEFHGQHIAPMAGAAVMIEWRPAVPRTERMKVREYTCDCRPVVYELCQAGGVRFIRRISRLDRRSLIEESRRDVAAVIDALWAELLRGEAR
ncbi:hypothetical protein ACQEUU_12240 [Nonomuraea sp. CA-218870]|uniref:hypothetical protein n=1 Tax=Nonomuraea sp. CA-218870 TaxID=3239998 RepID=UPI003D8A50C0